MTARVLLIESPGASRRASASRSREDVGVAHADAPVGHVAGQRGPGRSVPWMPTKPPAGQSVSVGDRALVPNATGP